MSDAVSVLKEMIDKRKAFSKFRNSLGELSRKEAKALSEALLALEKQEKLKKWLDKEIKYWAYADGGTYSDTDILDILNKCKGLLE